MRSRRSADDGHGLSTAEEAIITRLEAGESNWKVAKALGFRPSTIAVIGRRYLITDRQLGAYEKKCRVSEARYRSALAATGKVYA